MFCPNCGGENPTELAFCRSCGENLKIISQAMSGNAPLAIATKIEEALSSNTFRLKRDAIWLGIAGVVATIATIIGGPLIFTTQIAWLQTLGMILLPAALFLFAGRDYLAYRRSLEKEGPRRLGGPQTLKLPEGADKIEPDDKDDPVFCPACGTENLAGTQYCRSCGGTLVFEPTGLQTRLPGFVIRNLDQRITNNEKFQLRYRSLKVSTAVGGLMLLNGALQFVSSGPTLASVLSLFSGLTFLILGTWDYLTFRRINPEKVDDRGPSFTQDIGIYFSDSGRRNTVVFQVLFFAALCVGAVVLFPELSIQILPVFILVVLAGLSLKIRQFRNDLTDESRRQEIARLSGIKLHETDHLGVFLHEMKSLPEVDDTASDLNHAEAAATLLSVTESTTKPLICEIEPVIEPVATTTKLGSEGS